MESERLPLYKDFYLALLKKYVDLGSFPGFMIIIPVFGALKCGDRCTCIRNTNALST